MSNPFSFEVETLEELDGPPGEDSVGEDYLEEERGRAVRFRGRGARVARPARVFRRRPRPRPAQGWRRPRWPYPPPTAEPAPPGAEPTSDQDSGAAAGSEPAAAPAAEGSERVRWIQSSLNAALGLRLPVDGHMGPDTRNAVRTFQQRHGLPADGIVGPDTERALVAGRRQPPPASPAEGAATELDVQPEVFEGSFELDGEETFEGEEGETGRGGPDYVRWIQQALNRLRSAGLAVDGKLTPATREAIRGFQRRHRLSPDGIVGSRTEDALIAAGAARPPMAPPRSCPEPAKPTVDRCLRPGSHTCPAIPNLLCVTSVDDVPFEYPEAIGRQTGTGLRVVTKRQRTRTQRFIPEVRQGLSRFIANMRRFGMPIEAIITWGSLYCRCIKGTNTPSNHSFGDAIDIVGVRWAAVGGPASQLRETIVHNYQNAQQRALLRRISACLRLSFMTVLDYHHSGHRDHFHCDTNRGRGPRHPLPPTVVMFVQEALSTVTGKTIPVNGRLDAATKAALGEFAGDPTVTSSASRLQAALQQLFTRIAAGR